MAIKKLLFHATDSSADSSIEIGTKAQRLRVLSSIVNVPLFWTISEKAFEWFLNECGVDSVRSFFTHQYSEKYEQLLYQSNCEIELDKEFSKDRKYIVRSSIVPYNNTGDFASEISGAFESIVSEGDNITKAIRQVYASVFSKKAYNQIRLFALNNNIKGMAIIIQEYITPRLSGVIHVTNSNSIHLQWLQGHLSEIVSGNEFGHSNLLYYNSNGDAIFRGSEKEIIYIRDNEIASVFQKYYHYL